MAPPFGFLIGDVVVLTQLAKSSIEAVQNACGEHDELTCEFSSLYAVLQ